MDITTLADIAQVSSDPNPRSRITVARLGKYSDPRYGKFEISEADYDGWKQNLASTFGGKVAVDFDHSSDRGRGTEASAWITGLERQGKDVIADVEWTPKGAAAVRDKSYQFISPTYTEHYKDETGTDRGRALLGAALTNRPVLRQLPTLSLSREEIDGVATADDTQRERERARELAAAAHSERKNPPPRDSRPQMDQTALVKLLDLEPDADEATILAKVAELKDTPAPAETQPAAEPVEKPVTLSTLTEDQLAQLLADANAGAAAARTLAEQTFETAWSKALSEGRAAPSQKDTVHALFSENPQLAIQTLDSFVKIVPTTPTGASGSDPNSPAGPAPMGMDEDRYQLHTQAKQLAQTKRQANPNLDAAQAYTMAVNELADRQYAQENPAI